LQVANVPAPYVLVGHSFGAVLNRIYTHYYPDEVLGVVLVDTAIFPPGSLDTQAKIDEWRFGNDVLQAVLWAMVRTGAARFVVGSEVESLGYPPDIAAEFTALKVSNQSFDTYYAESFPVRLELVQEANKGENLGDLPLVALWATVLPRQLTPEEQDQLGLIQQATSEYSSNGVSRMVEGSTHGSIIGSEVYAERVSDAVYDVIGSVESGELLTE
jgi:pimeloyl-ACP methyl ester carboxylesterase